MTEWAMDVSEAGIAAIPGATADSDGLAATLRATRLEINPDGGAPAGLNALAPDVLIVPIDAPTDILRVCREAHLQTPTTTVVLTGPADRVGDGYQALRLGGGSWLDPSAVDAVYDIKAIATLGISVLAPAQAGWLVAELDAARNRVSGADHPIVMTSAERSLLVALARGERCDQQAAGAGVAPRSLQRLVTASLARLHRMYVPSPSEPTSRPGPSAPDAVRALAPQMQAAPVAQSLVA